MLHGGEIYDKRIELDFSVSLNPMPCPKEVQEAVRQAALEVSVYPDIRQRAFREAVAMAENTPADNIVGGNGASELLMAIVNMVRPKKALLPVPSFYGYEHVLRACSAEIEQYYLDESVGFELGEDFVHAITEFTDMVILGNPNNPTGRLISEDVLVKIMDRCRETGTTLVVDECFIRLTEGSTSARDYIDEYPNLFVVDAYTKLFSIPGVRVGFVITAKDNAKKIWNFLPEWNMSVFADRAGIACAKIAGEGSFTRESLDIIGREREYLAKELTAAGLTVFSSDTNFLLIRSDEALYKTLLEKGILIRNCNTFEGLSEGYYRIAVKDHASNERLMETIR